ncbi:MULTISPECIES: hypothetical protein [unclassified Pedobacter]|uniref:hypothetical protein n=1 Tax=unclassified Pedobacter TaxID=2628915 RepID=UPI001E49EA1D|nr:MULTISPECIES: hypothetical protein [unclassified Pedobacter]
MKKLKSFPIYVFSIFSAIYGQELKAQGTGIGTKTPHASTILEVSSSLKNGGVLVPKVNLKAGDDILTIPNPAIGLMVYNTNTAGIKPNNVEADHHYFWNGSSWIDIADINTIKKLLLPQVFFCQEPVEQELTSANLTAINGGSDVVVTFNNIYVLTNNGGNVSLNNNRFTINNTGEYEISGYINYNPHINNNANSNTNLLYKIQRSTNGGTNWVTVAQTTLVWGKDTGGFSRTLISPPSIIHLDKNDVIQLVISKTFGSNHQSPATISVPGGLNFSKNIRIFKLD